MKIIARFVLLPIFTTIVGKTAMALLNAYGIYPDIYIANLISSSPVLTNWLLALAISGVLWLIIDFFAYQRSNTGGSKKTLETSYQIGAEPVTEEKLNFNPKYVSVSTAAMNVSDFSAWSRYQNMFQKVKNKQELHEDQRMDMVATLFTLAARSGSLRTWWRFLDKVEPESR